MVRLVTAYLLSALLASILAGCVVQEERRCPDRWEPGHRDRWGHWIEGHCR